MSEVLHADGPEDRPAIDAAERALSAGELVVFPTDTVYGVAARPDRPGATDRIFEAKERPRGLTLPVLVSRIGDAEGVAVFDERARKLAARFWPGGLTIVLPRTERSAGWDLGEASDSVGVRVPSNGLALALLDRTGPLAATSANRSGEPTPAECEGVTAALGDAVAVYVCTGRPAGRVSSTVVDLTGAEPILLRAGVIRGGDVLAAL